MKPNEITNQLIRMQKVFNNRYKEIDGTFRNPESAVISTSFKKK